MLIAAARLNIPAIIVSGGPMLSINYKDKYRDLNTAFEQSVHLKQVISMRTNF